MKHQIELTDIECMVVLDGLNMICSSNYKHKDDKKIAKEVIDKVLAKVREDKNA